VKYYFWVLLAHTIFRNLSRYVSLILWIVLYNYRYYLQNMFESRSGRGVQHYMIKFVSHLRQVGGFLPVLLFPPPIKRFNWNIVESRVKHRQANRIFSAVTLIFMKKYNIYLIYLYHISNVHTAIQVYIQMYLYKHHISYHSHQINTHHMIYYNWSHSDHDYILYKKKHIH
jgi:hypothetical protein